MGFRKTVLLLALTTILGAQSPRLIATRQGAEKAKALRRFGGNRSSERMVSAGLDWLERHQDPDGGWDADGFSKRCHGAKCQGIGKGQHGEAVPCPFDLAISSLATLAFLGAGHLPRGKLHGQTVTKALNHLENARGRSWGRVLSLQALAEAEAMGGTGRWRKEVQSRAAQLLAQRGRDGAFGYAQGFRRGSDVPYSALVVQALVSARDCGFSLPQDFAPRIDTWLDTLEVRKGRLAYIKNGRRFGYTPTSDNAACAAAMRALLQINTRGKRHKLHMALLARERPIWKISFKTLLVPGRGRMKVQVGRLSLYRWWYGTLATFHSPGSQWSPWYTKLKSALKKKQRKSGCARGSWDPKGTYERQTGGRIFATALAVLSLEQPYRQRPQGK